VQSANNVGAAMAASLSELNHKQYISASTYNPITHTYEAHITEVITHEDGTQTLGNDITLTGDRDTAPVGEIESLGAGYRGVPAGSGLNDCSVVSGWVCDRDFPNEGISINLSVGGAPLASFKSDIVRLDLYNNIYYRSGRLAEARCGKSPDAALWGFRYPLPLWMKDGML
jgi:hypothetical protein